MAVWEAHYPAAHVIEHRNYGTHCDLLLFHTPADLPLVSQLDADKVGYWVETDEWLSP